MAPPASLPRRTRGRPSPRWDAVPAWFNGQLLAVKLLVVPVAVILLMTLLSAISLLSVARQGRVLAEFGQVLLPRGGEIDRALDMAAQAHTELFRAVSWAANSDEQAKLALYGDRLDDDLRSLRAMAGDLPRRWDVPAADRAPFAELGPLVDSYGEAAAIVLKMARTEPATSFVMMFRADKRFSTLRAALVGVRDAEEARTRLAIERALAEERPTEISFLALLAAAILVSALLTAWLARRISQPIRRMTEAMAALAQGRRGVAIPAAGRTDEVGRMAEAVRVFADAMAAAARLAREREAEREGKVARSARIEGLSAAFDLAVTKLVGALSAAAEDMRATAESMASVAARTDARAMAVANAADAAAQDVTTIAVATGELSRSITGIGRLVAGSTEVTRAAILEVRRTTGVAQDLAQGVRSIDRIVHLIRSIATQTRLLALNATIEAAPGGRGRRRLRRRRQRGQDPRQPDQRRHRGDRRPGPRDRGLRQCGRCGHRAHR